MEQISFTGNVGLGENTTTFLVIKKLKETMPYLSEANCESIVNVFHLA